MNLPTSIIKIIADYTGHPWRLRICRKWRGIVDFPAEHSDSIIVYTGQKVPYHPSRIIHITTPAVFHSPSSWAVQCVPRGFVVLWSYNEKKVSMRVDNPKFKCQHDYMQSTRNIYKIYLLMNKIFN